MQKHFHVMVTEKNCKKCGICSALCPRHVLKQDAGQKPVVIHPEDCVGCRLCQMRCPDFAIEVGVRA